MSNLIGHFDQREQLLELLEASTRHAPAPVSLDEYKSWTPAKRRSFDQERSRRIADSIVIITPALQELRLSYRRAARVAHLPV